MTNIKNAHTHTYNKKECSILNIDIDINANLPCSLNIDEVELFSLGVHPWKVSAHKKIFKVVESLSQSTQCVAIGETGLDRTHMKTFDQQIASTMQHIQLAQKINKPIIFHCVRAYQDLYHLLLASQYRGKFMLHDYNGNAQTTNQFMKLESVAYFSFGKRLYTPYSKLVNSIDSIPPHRVLLETDDQENYAIENIYKKFIAMSKTCGLNTSDEVISRNFNQFIS